MLYALHLPFPASADFVPKYPFFFFFFFFLHNANTVLLFYLTLIVVVSSSVNKPRFIPYKTITPQKKTSIPADFCDGCYTIHLFTKKNHIQQQQQQKHTFQRKFFDEIWLIIEDHEYITLLKIKLIFVLFCFLDFRAKQISPTPC